jgi:hypothetical protein
MSVVSVFYDDDISGIGSNNNRSPQYKMSLAKTSKEYNMDHFSDILAMELK